MKHGQVISLVTIHTVHHKIQISTDLNLISANTSKFLVLQGKQIFGIGHTCHWNFFFVIEFLNKTGTESIRLGLLPEAPN